MAPDTSAAFLNRRRFLLAGAAAGAALLPGAAFAQNALGDLLKAPTRGNWDDQFDTRSSGQHQVASNSPIFSQNTLRSTEQAIDTYGRVLQMGGWPTVPGGQTLRLGVNSPAVEALRSRLAIVGDLPQSAGQSPAFDSYVDAAVKRFQSRHGMPADGIVGESTLKALNVPADIRLGQLRTNYARIQDYVSREPEPRFVMVNIPAAAIEAVENGRVIQRHTAVVGKIDRQTPILDSKITNLILNPYWHAPVSIVRKDIIPLVRKDPTYLERANIHIFDGNGTEIPPTSIDWNSDEATRYLFRQDPGPSSAMASVKINFPNTHSVYMHDTPEQSLFSDLMRFDSSGCVRVQNVRDLVVWLARDTPGWDRQSIEREIASGESQSIDLANPVPVHFAYITAWATDPSVVQFRDDIYHRDGDEQLAANNLTTTAYAANEQNVYGVGDSNGNGNGGF